MMRLGKFVANGVYRVQSVHLGHLQVHQRDVRAVHAELLNRLPSIRRFRNQIHVRLAAQQRCDSLPEHRVIVDCKNPN
jgi:hypothetical protein